MKRSLIMFVVGAWLLPLHANIPGPDPASPFGLGLGETVSVPLPASAGPPARAFVRQPLRFERNDGQTDCCVSFVSRGRGYTLFLARNEAVFSLRSREGRVGDPLPATRLRDESGQPRVTCSTLRMRLLGANPSPAVAGEEKQRATANYFIGNVPGNWRTNIPTFGKVRYQGVYPGIDLVYYGKEGDLEYDFVVGPGADPNRIAMEFQGAEELRVDPAGDLVLKVGGREVRWQKPHVFQEVGGTRVEIAGFYRIGPGSAENNPQDAKDLKRVSFTLAAYDSAVPLVIDPRLVYSTYLGGSGEEKAGQTVAVDKEGNVYVAGTTASVDFPTKSALQGSASGGETDAFVAKFNGAGQLLFSTYLGGSARDSMGSIASTASGDCYLAGSTQSGDFPLVNPLQAAHGGGDDVFVATLEKDGSVLLFSTYFGGRANDRPLALSAGPGDDLFVSGYTYSPNFPTTNAFQSRLSSPYEGWQQPDGFLTRFEAGGKSIRYSTYYGRTGLSDWASGLAVDAEGNAYVAVLSDWIMQGQWVIARISNDGRTRLFERRWPAVRAVYPIQQFLLQPRLALAPNGRLVLAAPVELEGELLPAINDPAPSIYTWSEVYIALFDATNGKYISAVYLGGIGNDGVGGLCVDAVGDIIVAGQASAQATENGTEPSGFPVTDPLDQGPEPGSTLNAFVVKYRSSDLNMVFSTLLGEFVYDSGVGLALDPDGSAWVVGPTTGPFPTVNGFQPDPGGGSDTFLSKISFGERLQITRSGQTLRISWPLAATGSVLETAESPMAADWTPAPAPPLPEGDQNVLTLEASGDSQYFRLRKP